MPVEPPSVGSVIPSRPMTVGDPAVPPISPTGGLIPPPPPNPTVPPVPAGPRVYCGLAGNVLLITGPEIIDPPVPVSVYVVAVAPETNIAVTAAVVFGLWLRYSR